MIALRKPTHHLAAATVTGSLRFGRAIVVAVLALSSTATAQPKAKQPAPEPAPPPPPPPDPGPETQKKLDEQATALAAASESLATQQRTIDSMGQALTQALQGQDELRQSIEAERQARLVVEEAAKASAAHPAVRSAWSYLTISGFLQVDSAIRQSSEDQLRQSGDTLNQDRFLLRRGRVRVTGTYGAVSGFGEIDLNTINGNQVRVSTAEAAYQIQPWLKAAVGIPKIPFGFEVEQSDKERLFLERSTVVRALFPGEYDVGAKLSGAWRFLRYALAVQNGEPSGSKSFAFRDPNQAKDITGRAGIETAVGSTTIAGGFSLLSGRGFHLGTPATKDVLVWKDLNEDGVVQSGEIQVIQGQAATPSANFDRFGLGVDAEIAVDLHRGRRLFVYGELIVAGNLDRTFVLPDPVVTGRDHRELGFYAGAVYEPAAWSAIGVRYDRYDPDADASELRTGNVIPVDSTLSTLGVAAALRHEHGRLILEYDHNTNHSARTMAGVPTNLGDDALTLRAEVQL